MLKQSIKSLIPPSLILTLHPLLMKRTAAKRGFSFRLHDSYIDVIKGEKLIRVARKHTIYLNDVFHSFDYYHRAVRPFQMNGFDIVDYSSPRYHDVIGFDLWPIMFPSLAEPVVTALQYLEFASLSADMTVIDLGTYSGLTSILFSQSVGQHGIVVAVDADPVNLQCIHRNIDRYRKYSSSTIRIVEGAVWNNSNGIHFSSEGNMGSSASTIVGSNRGQLVKVPTLTLSDVAKRNELTRVDFIKCDIEGAESVVFEDKLFFEKFRPRIIVEPHVIDGKLTSDKVIADLSLYGYKCRTIRQEGVELPLIECIP